MTLRELMTFWQMKNLVSEKRILYSAQMFDDERENYTVRSAKIRKDFSTHAEIIYASNGDTLRLLNACIIFTSIASNIPDRVFIKNANLRQLEEHVL